MVVHYAASELASPLTAEQREAHLKGLYGTGVCVCVFVCVCVCACVRA